VCKPLPWGRGARAGSGCRNTIFVLFRERGTFKKRGLFLNTFSSQLLLTRVPPARAISSLKGPLAWGIGGAIDYNIKYYA